MRRLASQIAPFLFLGLAITTFAFGIVLFAYLFFFGLIFSLVVFFIAWVRQRFFSSPSINTPTPTQTRKGRIIDSNDWNQL